MLNRAIRGQSLPKYRSSDHEPISAGRAGFCLLANAADIRLARPPKTAQAARQATARGLARRDPLGRRQMRASYSMYPVSGSTCDRKFRIASSWSTMLDGRPSDDAEENP